MALGRNFRLRLAWLAAVALAVGPLALTPAAHAAAAAADDQGIQDTGGFGFYDVMANDGTDGSQSVSLPGNTDADVTTDGSSISVDLSADVSPFVGTKTITYELDDIDLNPIGQATLTVKVVDPSGVQITAGNGQATVSWPGLPNGITGMRITSSTSPIFDHSTGTTITSAGTGPHDVTGLTNGTTYFFYVTAMFAGQDDPSGATGSAAPRAAANHAPVAVADTVSLVDPNPKQLSPTGNDTDADGDLLVITGHSAPAHGTVTCGSDSCEYTPDAAPVDDTFTYSIADGFGGTDTGTVTLVARHVTANPDPVSTFVDESTSVDVLANDTFLLAGDSPNLGAVPAGVDAFVEADGTVAVSGLTQGPYQIPYDVLDTDGDILASSHLSVTVGAKRPLVAFHDDATTDLDLAT
ncbi:MAG: large repetitive protein, partial [Nocardioidaceae bacterium]|nr:large repetitive protein [Nocardioidaceae bacterium]